MPSAAPLLVVTVDAWVDPSILAFALSAKVSECNAADPIENVQHFSLLLEINPAAVCHTLDISVVTQLCNMWHRDFVSFASAVVRKSLLVEFCFFREGFHPWIDLTRTHGSWLNHFLFLRAYLSCLIISQVNVVFDRTTHGVVCQMTYDFFFAHVTKNETRFVIGYIVLVSREENDTRLFTG